MGSGTPLLYRRRIELRSKQVALVVGLAMALTARQASAQALETTVCEILADPSAYVGRPVVVQGTIDIGRHTVLLRDSRCTKAIPLEGSAELANDPNWKKLDAAMFGGGVVRLTISGLKATVVGSLVSKPDPVMWPFVMSLRQMRAIDIPAP